MEILFLRDMNAHIWELDKCAKGSVTLLRQLTGDLGLHIMNCVWKRMSGATWSMDGREFTVDYVCVYREGLAYLVETATIDEVDMVYNDHTYSSKCKYRMEGNEEDSNG